MTIPHPSAARTPSPLGRQGENSMEDKQREAARRVAQEIAEAADEILECFGDEGFREEFERWRKRNPKLMQMVHEAEERMEEATA